MTTGFSGNTYTGSNEPTPVERAYAEGYKAGRIRALRQVGCQSFDFPDACAKRWIGLPIDVYCAPCRLLAESEQGEVGGDR